MSTIRSAGIGSFKGLSDTPNSYVGQTGKFVKVLSTEDGVEFSASVDTSNVLLSNVTCDSTVFIGACVYMNASGVAFNASSAGISTANFIGIVESKASSVLCDIRVQGVTGSLFTTLDPTKEYYLGLSGAVTTAPPTGSGTVLLRIGQPFSATEMLVMKGLRTVRA